MTTLLKNRIIAEQKRIEEDLKEDYRAEQIPASAISSIQKKWNRLIKTTETETYNVSIIVKAGIEYPLKINEVLDLRAEEFESRVNTVKITGDITNLDALQEVVDDDSYYDFNSTTYKSMKSLLLEIKQDILALSKLYNVSPEKILEKF